MQSDCILSFFFVSYVSFLNVVDAVVVAFAGAFSSLFTPRGVDSVQ